MGRPKRRINEAKHAYWRRVLQQWRDSGLGIREFCRQHRHHESQFWFWKRRLGEHVDATPNFVPVTVVDAPIARSPFIDIRLISGHRLRVRPGCDRQLLADVVAVLEGKPC
jgi:hypothetical protein